MPTAIPVMIDPLSRHWRAPHCSRFQIDDTHARMRRRDLMALPEYSSSIPTGTYAGKTWRCRRGADWLVCWFHVDARTPRGSVSIAYRIARPLD